MALMTTGNRTTAFQTGDKFGGEKREREGEGEGRGCTVLSRRGAPSGAERRKTGSKSASSHRVWGFSVPSAATVW